MDVITKDVRALAKKELAAANRRFRMFASPHEGYAVIREELDELIDEVRKPVSYTHLTLPTILRV